MTKVLFPGSFDPITKGHMNIIEQASTMFDEVTIAVLQNPGKKEGFFTIEERIEIIKQLYNQHNNIKVVTGNIAVELALLHECSIMIRSIRNGYDYEYEAKINQINKDLCNTVNTILLFPDPKYQFISSSDVKAVFSLNRDISKYVHPLVQEKMLIKKR